MDSDIYSEASIDVFIFKVLGKYDNYTKSFTKLHCKNKLRENGGCRVGP